MEEGLEVAAVELRTLRWGPAVVLIGDGAMEQNDGFRDERSDWLSPVHHPEKRAGYIHSSTSGLSPREQLERQEESHPPEKTRPDSPVPTCRDLAI